MPARLAEPKRFARFAAVGAIATSLHWGITAWLLFATGMPEVTASTIGFVSSATLNYALNARMTFQASPSITSAWRFAIAAGSGCVFNAVVLKAMLGSGFGVASAQFVATLGVLVWNFAVHSIWVFRHPDPA